MSVVAVKPHCAASTPSLVALANSLTCSRISLLILPSLKMIKSEQVRYQDLQRVYLCSSSANGASRANVFRVDSPKASKSNAPGVPRMTKIDISDITQRVLQIKRAVSFGRH